MINKKNEIGKTTKTEERQNVELHILYINIEYRQKCKTKRRRKIDYNLVFIV